jgi:hypothetical protein
MRAELILQPKSNLRPPSRYPFGLPGTAVTQCVQYLFHSSARR